MSSITLDLMVRELAWNVSRDVKPACEFEILKSDFNDIKQAIAENFPELKVYKTKTFGNLIMVHIYKYDHVKAIIDKVYRTSLYNDAYNPIRHVLSAYLYGIPAHKVQEFCDAK